VRNSLSEKSTWSSDVVTACIAFSAYSPADPLLGASAMPRGSVASSLLKLRTNSAKFGTRSIFVSTT
jgi:hypothetical protein